MKPDQNKAVKQKKVLITGGEGYIGSNLKMWLRKKKDEVFLFVNNTPDGKKRFKVDITDSQKVLSLISRIKPEVIFHTAAISSLSVCEKDPNLAERVNVGGTGNIIRAIKKVNPNIKLVFFSSDYIFDGKKGNYAEKNTPNPKTIYGKTKLKAETNIVDSLENYIICRTANVFGRGGNFFKFVLDSLESGKKIEVFDDTFYTPTYIDFLLDSLEKLVENDFRGVIHVVGREKVSRYQFAVMVAEAWNKNKSLVRVIRQPKGGLVAQDSSLDSSLLRETLNNFCPPIEKCLQYCLGNLLSPCFYFSDDRGKIIGISRSKRWEEINYIDSLGGTTRGNHYHKKTLEGFFIIKGKIKVLLQNVNSVDAKTILVGAGDTFLVEPNILHTFEVLEDSCWINFLSRPVDQNGKDFYKL